MADRITIPAACLEALGGLREEDPPVLVVSDQDHGMWEAYHPSTAWTDHPPRGRILVRQSAPALLAVIERASPRTARRIALDLTDGRLRRLADALVATAIAAHGSDPGWKVEVTP